MCTLIIAMNQNIEDNNLPSRDVFLYLTLMQIANVYCTKFCKKNRTTFNKHINEGCILLSVLY